MEVQRHPEEQHLTTETLKLLEEDRFHVDIHTAAWNGHTDVLLRLLKDPSILHSRDATEFGVRLPFYQFKLE